MLICSKDFQESGRFSRVKSGQGLPDPTGPDQTREM